jgi:hypothetical protein
MTQLEKFETARTCPGMAGNQSPSESESRTFHGAYALPVPFELARSDFGAFDGTAVFESSQLVGRWDG